MRERWYHASSVLHICVASISVTYYLRVSTQAALQHLHSGTSAFTTPPDNLQATLTPPLLLSCHTPGNAGWAQLSKLSALLEGCSTKQTQDLCIAHFQCNRLRPQEKFLQQKRQGGLAGQTLSKSTCKKKSAAVLHDS